VSLSPKRTQARIEFADLAAKLGFGGKLTDIWLNRRQCALAP
jgi:hypothetical protein